MTARPDRLQALEEQVAALTGQVDRLRHLANFFEERIEIYALARQAGYDHALDDMRPAARPGRADNRSRARLSVVGPDGTPGGAA